MLNLPWQRLAWSLSQGDLRPARIVQCVLLWVALSAAGEFRDGTEGNYCALETMVPHSFLVLYVRVPALRGGSRAVYLTSALHCTGTEPAAVHAVARVD